MSTMTRGSRSRSALALAILTMLVVVAIVALWPRPGEDAAEGRDAGHSGHVSAVVGGARGSSGGEGGIVVPPESDSAGNTPQTSLAAAAGAAPFSSEKGTGPSQSAPDTSATGETKGARRGAAGLGKPRPDVKPADVIAPETGLGGCSAAYGDDGQCLPSVPPSQAAHVSDMIAAGLDPASMAHPWTCAEVRNQFPDGIAVRVPGVDPDRLDPDTDGVACEPE